MIYKAGALILPVGDGAIDVPFCYPWNKAMIEGGAVPTDALSVTAMPCHLSQGERLFNISFPFGEGGLRSKTDEVSIS